MSEQVWMNMWECLLHMYILFHGCKHWWFLKKYFQLICSEPSCLR